MPKLILYKNDIARSQLETAISIFLLPKPNYPAVITLCGASGNILDQIVKRKKKESFIDYVRRLNSIHSGKIQKRKSMEHYINSELGILIHKHLWDGDLDPIEIDLKEMAYNSIVRCVADYRASFDDSNVMIDRFLTWSWQNANGVELMEAFKNVP